MKISKDLPQFREGTVLIAAGGELKAKFYLAGNGEINLASELLIEKPKYTDREGMFMQSGRGQEFSRGSVYESKKEHLQGRFAKEMADRVKRVSENHKLSAFYIFMPGHILANAVYSLPSAIKGILKGEFAGNYTDSHPFSLLSLIKSEESSPYDPSKKEAKKLKDKPEPVR